MTVMVLHIQIFYVDNELEKKTGVGNQFIMINVIILIYFANLLPVLIAEGIRNIRWQSLVDLINEKKYFEWT